MKEWKSENICIIGETKSYDCKIPPQFTKSLAASVKRFHEMIPSYGKTPLYRLSSLSKKLGVREIFAKDESGRFSLKSFKGLGGSYAMFRILCKMLDLDPESASLQDIVCEENREMLSRMEFATCTDGNHGKGISWAASLFGCRAHVYMPAGTEEVRAQAIRSAGPCEVTITDFNYDETVRYVSAKSAENGWILIQDTSWDGYEEIPGWIIQGYLTLASEITDDLDSTGFIPTHVFLQAGVGSMAGAVAAYLTDYYKDNKPVITIVEPFGADCIAESARRGDGLPHTTEGSPITIMAGLNCGTPCSVVWPILRDHAGFYVSCADCIAENGMRIYASKKGGDPVIVSGGSGASTLGAAVSILSDASLANARSAMGLDHDSVILLINTEGDTDPDNYKAVISSGNIL